MFLIFQRFLFGIFLPILFFSSDFLIFGILPFRVSSMVFRCLSEKGNANNLWPHFSYKEKKVLEFVSYTISANFYSACSLAQSHVSYSFSFWRSVDLSIFLCLCACLCASDFLQSICIPRCPTNLGSGDGHDC